MRKITTLLFLIGTFTLSAQTNWEQQPTTASPQKETKFLINISAGPSFRIAKNPAGLDAAMEKYLKEIKSGFSYDVSAYFLRDEKVGFGLRYNAYKSSGKFTSSQLLDPNGESGPGTASDDITITFIGVGVLVQDKGFLPHDKVSLEAALGYIGYINNTTVLHDYKLTGSSIGLSTTLGYHFGITPTILVGPTVAFTGGILKKFDIKGNGMDETIRLPKDTYESLYRLDLSVSARFMF